MWWLQTDREFKAANVADNGKSFEHLRGWLFGPWEEVTWLEEINWSQLEKTFPRRDCVFCFASMLDLCACTVPLECGLKWQKCERKASCQACTAKPKRCQKLLRLLLNFKLNKGTPYRLLNQNMMNEISIGKNVQFKWFNLMNCSAAFFPCLLSQLKCVGANVSPFLIMEASNLKMTSEKPELFWMPRR